MSRDPYRRRRGGDYHCPYCSPLPTRSIQGVNGSPHCAYCGDPLVREPHVRGSQIAAMLVIGGFLLPLISLLWLAIQLAPSRRTQPQERVAMIRVVETHAPERS